MNDINKSNLAKLGYGLGEIPTVMVDKNKLGEEMKKCLGFRRDQNICITDYNY